MYARATMPGSSISSVTLSYPYPKLLEVLSESHTFTRNPQTLQNITLQKCFEYISCEFDRLSDRCTAFASCATRWPRVFYTCSYDTGQRLYHYNSESCELCAECNLLQKQHQHRVPPPQDTHPPRKPRDVLRASPDYHKPAVVRDYA